MATQVPEVTSVKVTGHYRLHVGFSDGTEGDIDVGDLRDAGGVFEPLRDPGYFAKAFVDGGAGTVVWPNGADLAPEVLHDELAGRGRPGDVPEIVTLSSEEGLKSRGAGDRAEDFSTFARREFESLVVMLTEITDLAAAEVRELVQLALTEASSKMG